MSGMFTDYYSAAKSGYMFHGQTAAAGVVIPLSTATAATFGLWNPSTGFNAVLLQVKIGWVATTGTPGAILYNALTAAGSALATAAPISAFTALTPTNALVGKGNAAACKPSSAATLTTAGTVIQQAGFSQLTTTGATTGSPLFSLIDDIDGKLIIPPQTYFYLTGTNASGLTSAMTCSISWVELPVV